MRMIQLLRCWKILRLFVYQKTPDPKLIKIVIDAMEERLNELTD